MINNTVCRPALRYHGGKWKIAPWIISHFPKHRIYVEPYGGAASVLLRKEKSYAEIYNDLDGEIVNFFKVVRCHGRSLKRALMLTPFARREFIRAYSNIKDPVETARKTIIKSFMGYGSDSIRRKSGFRCDSMRSGTTPAHDWKNYADHIEQLIERFRDVIIEDRPALEVIKNNDTPETLFYVDPPYLHSLRSSVSNKAYRHEMDNNDHVNLAKVLRSVEGKVVVSGYESELYNDLYLGWNKDKKKSLADGARARVEVIWKNFEEKNLKLL